MHKQTNEIKYGIATKLEQFSVLSRSDLGGLEAGSQYFAVSIETIISCQDSPVADRNSTIRARGNDRKLLCRVISESPVFSSNFILPNSCMPITA